MKIPDKIKGILSDLQKSGFQAFIVGGCVRDFLLEKEPQDWDITTDATPQEIQKIFPDSFYENDFGTVSVKIRNQSPTSESSGEVIDCVEITPFRLESSYSDNRHPDVVKWGKNIEEDLSRRDFSINGIAIQIKESSKAKKEEIEIIDSFNGRKDIENKVIRAIGDPQERFREDALRLMRAVRFSTVLQFKIEPKTKKAIIENAKLLKNISQERIRDELVKIMQSDHAHDGIEMLRELGLLEYIIPELLEGFGVGQNKHHKFEIYEHNLKTLEYSTKKKFGFDVKMASLLHDVAKPKTKQGNGLNSTFYNHEIVGAKMTRNILTRLKFSKKDIDRISLLVRYHLFYYNVGEVTEASIRRLIKNVGLENVDDLINLRMADRIGSGCPKAEPYKLRHLKYLIARVSQDPISAKMIKINGNDLISLLNIPPSKKIGNILEILLADVLNNPKLNDKKILQDMATSLSGLREEELEKRATKARQEIEKVETKRDTMAKEKYWVS
ncbi:MAG TPA: CCA tRNA nucleotidyltransferase [Candidatus Pacearchaeota archaeon]|nr:CCA tRNA nucleotidyltransferase [Candidatus Parcubacteria bacterium]HOU45658.1 CCA tRNA nucleotidyltransferase [Candidatus Pacearchaeota archaeon]HPM08280.1 CCA tRNA nucleotidyltransferase [Candidatus Pacearchaeota archaeon]HQI74587.1 CCA tRNA nucleotidyltransferase [Candidatus Pacearchaeota archaeon]